MEGGQRKINCRDLVLLVALRDAGAHMLLERLPLHVSTRGRLGYLEDIRYVPVYGGKSQVNI